MLSTGLLKFWSASRFHNQWNVHGSSSGLVVLICLLFSSCWHMPLKYIARSNWVLSMLLPYYLWMKHCLGTDIWVAGCFFCFLMFQFTQDKATVEETAKPSEEEINPFLIFPSPEENFKVPNCYAAPFVAWAASHTFILYKFFRLMSYVTWD